MDETTKLILNYLFGLLSCGALFTFIQFLIQRHDKKKEDIKEECSEELKQEEINETLRLLYVGITRAKQSLFFTNAKNYKRRKNTKPIAIIQKSCSNTV